MTDQNRTSLVDTDLIGLVIEDHKDDKHILKQISFSATSAKIAGFSLLDRVNNPKSPEDPVMIFPALVNIALATEIQMKYLAYSVGDKLIKIHNLRLLFNRLPEPMRNAIRSEVEKTIHKNEEYNGVVYNFDEELNACSNYFEEMRYYHELPLNKVSHIFFIPVFCNAVFNQDVNSGSRHVLFYKGEDKLGKFYW